MNYLQLCQHTLRDCSLAEITSTANLTLGTTESKVCTWVNDAYLELQAEPRQWSWMRATLDFPVLPNIFSYDAASAWTQPNIEDFDQQRRHALMIRGDGSYYSIRYMEPDQFVMCYPAVGANSPQPSPPSVFTYDRGIVTFNAIPDQPYTLRAHIRYGEFPLVADTDVPLFKSKFHTVLVYRATMSYCAHDGDSALYQAAKQKFDRTWGSLISETVPHVVYRPKPLVR